MIYELRITAPANTAQTAPVETDLVVMPGLVRQVEVQFPSGCAGLVHVQILHWERVVWPSGVNQDFAADDTHLVFPEEYPVKGWPFLFTVRVWNDDDTYEHTPIVRLAIQAEAVGLLDRLLGLIGGPRAMIGSGG